MATEFLQATDAQAAAFNSADLSLCRIVVPFAHKLVSARVFTQNVVTTGTVTVSLKQTDVSDARAGSVLGTVLNNAALLGNTSRNTEIPFVLADAELGIVPSGRQYFLVLTATNSADRVDEPVLLLEVDRV